MVCAKGRNEIFFSRFSLGGQSFDPHQLMKRLLVLLSLVVALQRVSALSIYEPFANATAYGGSPYAIGSLLCSGTGTAELPVTNATGGIWLCISNEPGLTSGTPTISSGNLAYPGLSASPGNSLTIPAGEGNMGRMALPFGPISSGQVYYSLMVQITSISALSTSPAANFFVALGDSTGAQKAAVARAEAQVVTKASGTGYVLGVALSPPKTTADYVYDTSVHQVGDILFIVADYDFTTGNANLWIDPPTSTFGAATPPTPTVTGTAGSGPSGGLIQSLMLGCFTTTQTPAYVVDDVRVALSWAVVTSAPDIQTQPASLNTNAGTTATFSVYATGGTPLSYQWMNSSGNLSDGGQIVGSSTATLSINNCNANNNDTYSVVVGNNYGTVTSSGASLSVNDPWIDTQPASLSLAPNSTAVFTVVAGGVPTLAYGWYKNGVPLSNVGNVSGAFTPSLTLSSISSSDSGGYVVSVTNGNGGVVQSISATLAVGDPAILVQPQSVTANYGTTANFKVSAQGQTTLSYSWNLNDGPALTDGGNIHGSLTSNLTVTAVSYLNAGTYYVNVTDTGGTAQSDGTATLTVIEPIITSQPVSVSNVQGTTATFNVGAIGAPTVSYQWSKNTVAYSGDGGNITGSQTATLTVSGVSAGDDGSYSVLVTDGSGMNIQSANAVLNVLTSPTIISEPSPLTLTPGNNATFAVGTSGATPMTNQWYSNNVLVATTTNSYYTVPNVQLGMSGNFKVVVANIAGSATSSVAALGVVPSIHFYSTNLVIVRVGDGAQTPNYNGNSLFLDQITTNGTYLNTVCIPSNGASALIGIGPSESGTTLTGTALSLSEDGLELVLAGYNTPVPYTAALQVSVPTSVPRGIALLNSSANYLLPIADTNSFNDTFFRGATSDGTNSFWGVGGASGGYYYNTGAPSVLIETSQVNLRTVNIFNGNLYGVGEKSAGSGSQAVVDWTGLPTAFMNPAVLFTPTEPGDLAIDSTGTNMYVSTPAGPAYYQFNGGNWAYQYTLSANFVGILYMAVDFSGPYPVIYGTTYDANYNHVVCVTDMNGTTVSGATIYTAGVNENIRGVRFGPGEPYFNFSRTPGAIILTWNGLYNLQSSTNVAGPYTNIVGATSPYTNAFNKANALFFHLVQ